MTEPINPERTKIKLMKMSKGYQWEISINGDDPLACVDEANAADLKLKGLYPEEAKK